MTSRRRSSPENVSDDHYRRTSADTRPHTPNKFWKMTLGLLYTPNHSSFNYALSKYMEHNINFSALVACLDSTDKAKLETIRDKIL